MNFQITAVSIAASQEVRKTPDIVVHAGLLVELGMSELGQLETFPALPRMSPAGGIAEEISAITDIGQRMSADGVTADSRQVSFDFRG